jgi:hypothetical protein
LSKVTTRIAAEPIKKPSEIRFVPVILNVRHEAGNQNQIDGALSKCLIGDVNVTTLGILRDRLHKELHGIPDFLRPTPQIRA